ncbi:medium-chain fatty-acid--CoA ligase [Rhodococcus aetherivorans]|uniref:Medium-chain fatty-acid--CoA ligase n=1 Tax=Rhodococcus aetherivorans TaxID=191292 RepID=A0ABQ0YHM5_9NOCA|nr:long-chain fatty acid--CoA ligase [Rhodococcus aetherivorans]ETT25289.1 o-succinylbenzoate--CoA ligase [Rhodococcus rhodochrous ATCC 21198]GES36005.1 medium-chain fatty-acid--CoA ligase [Rhodococcus aetherivorans]
MQSLMMDVPLQIKTLLWRAERLYGHKEIIARTGDAFDAFTFTELGRRARKLSNVLAGLGVTFGDRVGTLAWNTAEHLVAYYAVPCMGAVLHTVNTRLSDDQIAYTIAHAGDTVLLVSSDQLPLLARLTGRLADVRTVVVLDGEAPADVELGVPVLAYTDLMAEASDEYDYPDLDENTAASMCYSSGTTGDPKGVVYSHRSTVLHALGLCTTGTIGVSEKERYLLVTPLSHVNSWGMPFACVLQGATIILPGDHPVGADYLKVIEDAAPTVLVGAVTVGMLIRRALEEHPGDYDVSSLHTMWLGGQAPPVVEMKWWKQAHGIHITQAWGMTEASPVLTFSGLTSTNQDLDEDARFEIFSTQGQPLPLVEIKLVREDESEAPWDGKTPGEVLVRAPWVISEYYNDPRSAGSFSDGWFRTGDIATMTQDGYLTIVDRAKDLIKSGGEWISSVELENALIAHPKVIEASVVGAPDPKWIERPVAFVVLSDTVSPDELKLFLKKRFPSFWVPDRFEVITELPKTSVGKFDKKRLRNEYV